MATELSAVKPALDAELARRRQELYELCASLIRIPSENPPGDTTRLVAFIVDHLSALGIKPQIHEPQRGMPNVVATLGTGRRNLVLACHLDEFPAGDGWSFPPFAGTLADGKIMGRGAGDMKAGLAVALFVVRLLKERDVQLDGRVTLALASDEETGGRWGTDWLLANVPDVRGDACLIGESSGTWSIGIGEKGVLWLRLSAAGVSGHAAYGQGSSAIAKVLRAVKTLEALGGTTARARRDITDVMRRQRPLVEKRWGPGTGRMADHLTLSLGTLRGGGQVNLIPGRCEAEVDFRLPPGMTTRALEATVRRRLRADGSKDVEITVLNRCDPYVSAPRDRLITTLVANGRELLGTAPAPVIRLGYTDGRFFRRAGIPTAVYGPRVHRMGGPDEYVEQDEVLQVARVHLATVLDYLDAR
jgi:succinyl-diaminopimelate desuccinylase